MDIARALGTPQKHDGYLAVGDDIVTWAYGHLATLAAPEQYDVAWKRWSWATLPMLPAPFALAPIAKTRSHLTLLKRLMRSADRLIAATDADREGELIFRYIYRLAGVQKPVDRLWLSENTPEAIRRAFERMKPASAYDALASAAESRAQADWLVGLNATRAFSLRHGQPGKPLSVGRVQTPTLRLIADRDQAIDAFVPTPYWQAVVAFEAPEGQYQGIWQGRGEHPDRILDEGEAQAIVDRVPPGTPGVIQSLETKRITVKPPLLYSLNDLQKDANRRLGMTAQQTLDAAQALYDAHLVSYPRTDSRYLTGEMARTLPERLAGVARQEVFAGLAVGVPHPLGTARLVNETDVAAAGHHALLPTGQRPGQLSSRDRQVYELIVRRFLAALYPAGLDERTTIMTDASEQRFKTTGTVVLRAGWRAVLQVLKDPDEEGEGESRIPPGLRSGEAVVVAGTALPAKETKAPPKLTDASLLALMEKHGLGTPATRARIVEVLLLRDYAERQKKVLQTTAKGRQLLTVLPDTIQSPEMTGQWESTLEEIASGAGDAEEFLAQIRRYTETLVETARQQAPSAMAVEDVGACPRCHVGRMQSNPKGWHCSRRREGCDLMIWGTVAGKKITEAQMKTLLAGKTTAELKGFKSKAGSKFSARLTWNADTERIEFVFTPRAASSAKRSGGRRRRTQGA